MRTYLIRFTYDHYCQGWEDATETVLVELREDELLHHDKMDLRTALLKITGCGLYTKARDFVDLTIR